MLVEEPKWEEVASIVATVRKEKAEEEWIDLAASL